MLVNYHFHDRRSPDATGTLEECVVEALHHGIHYLGVSNHAEWGNIMDIDEVVQRFSEGRKECYALNKKYPKMHIAYGYEAGLELIFREAHEALQKKVKFDFILGSVHKVDMIEVFDSILQKPYKEAIQDYLNHMIEGLQWGKFTHVSHFDLFKRYASQHFDATWNILEFQDQLEQIASLIRAKNMVVEINCSSLFFPAKETMPGSDVIKFFIDHGITQWTLGSDSHKPKDFAKGLQEGLQLLQSFGIQPVKYEIQSN